MRDFAAELILAQALSGQPNEIDRVEENIMVKHLVYGKIIIDTIRLLDGQLAHGVLGGGGPQGAFGARVWSDSVGFLSRSGTDIEPGAVAALRSLDIDLSGWVRYADLPTFRGGLVYDDRQQLVPDGEDALGASSLPETWRAMLARDLPLPETYRAPRAMHLITEFHDEAMVRDALALRAAGAVFSLEPIIDTERWSNREAIVSLLPQVDLVTPDWPSASGIAGSDDPVTVMRYWSRLGAGGVAVRNSEHGSYVWSREGDACWHIPAVPVPVVDPTGAGNSYGGGWCVGWCETRDVRLAGCYGAVSAAFALGQPGLPAMTSALRAEARGLLTRAVVDARRMW
jgi:cytidine kinase